MKINVQDDATSRQSCQMEYILSYQKSKLGYIWRALEWKFCWYRYFTFDCLEYFTPIWYILQPFGILWSFVLDFPVWVYCENLATLVPGLKKRVAMNRR
jgi:hypothetical protein